MENFVKVNVTLFLMKVYYYNLTEFFCDALK